jgi:hypothetical protein
MFFSFFILRSCAETGMESKLQLTMEKTVKNEYVKKFFFNELYLPKYLQEINAISFSLHEACLLIAV